MLQFKRKASVLDLFAPSVAHAKGGMDGVIRDSCLPPPVSFDFAERAGR